MSEDVLLYAARVSGLMAWILAFGALAAGLLARSTPDTKSNAGLWAADTRNLLGRMSVLGIVIHAASIAATERFDPGPAAVLIGRGPEGWVTASLLIGTICAWATVVVELVRFVVRRFGPATELVVLTIAAAVVVGGAYHGWEIGSDTNNPFAVAVVVVCAVLLLGAAAIGFTTVMAPALGDVRTTTEGGQFTDRENGWASARTGGSDDLFQSRSALGPDESQGGRNNHNGPVDPGLLSLSRPVEPPQSAAVRGPEIASARDVAVPHNTDGQAPETDDQSAWTMRKLPDAPQPQHRKRPRR